MRIFSSPATAAAATRSSSTTAAAAGEGKGTVGTLVMLASALTHKLQGCECVSRAKLGACVRASQTALLTGKMTRIELLAAPA